MATAGLESVRDEGTPCREPRVPSLPGLSARVQAHCPLSLDIASREVSGNTWSRELAFRPGRLVGFYPRRPTNIYGEPTI